MHQIRFPLGLCHRPRWRSLQHSLDTQLYLNGPTSDGRRGEGEEMGRRGRGEMGKKREEKGLREGRGENGERERKWKQSSFFPSILLWPMPMRPPPKHLAGYASSVSISISKAQRLFQLYTKVTIYGLISTSTTMQRLAVAIVLG